MQLSATNYIIAVMMFRLIISGILFFCGFGPELSAQLTVFRSLDKDRMIVRASSTYSSTCAVEHLIDNSGMNGLLHDNSMAAQTMWHSDRMPPVGKAFEGTKEGRVWISFEFDKIYPIKEIWIWNHNQPGYSKRGLKKTYIQYSSDGKNWASIDGNSSDSWIIPEANAKINLPGSIILNCNGLVAKYIVITADEQDGNYGDEYYGLSEVKFITTEKLGFKDCLSVRGDDRVFKGKQYQRLYDIFIKGGIAYGEDKLTISASGQKQTMNISAVTNAFQQASILLPFDIDQGSSTSILLESKKGGFKIKSDVPSPTPFDIYLIPQSHVDIGYTDYPEKVAEYAIKNINYAIDLAEKTQNYPEGSAFKWNTEVLWTVEEYFKKATDSERKRFLDAIARGWINLDGAYASINTSLCNGEELLRLFSYANDLKQKYNLAIHTAQQVDVPGMSWGIVPSMRQSGMKYMLNLPNLMDDRSLENKPFYWCDPSGRDSVLHFQTYYYNLGYELKGKIIPNYLAGNNDPYFVNNPDSLFLDPFIFTYLDDIRLKGYFYDMIPFAWTMTDNAPLDPDLPEVVKRWNEKYKNPRVIISTANNFFTLFEQKYKSKIPVFKGEYNEYWTDGVASGARETAVNRNNSERVLQAEVLYALLHPEFYDPLEFKDIWKNILLFTEHTWGSYKSVSNPDDPDVKAQWKIKASYALNARDKIENQLQRLQQNLQKENSFTEDKVDIVNTSSWKRSGVVYIPETLSKSGNDARDENGRMLSTQRLASGELAVYIDSIEGFNKRSLSIKPGNFPIIKASEALSGMLENQFYSVCHEKDNSISIKFKESGEVFLLPLNKFCRYVLGTGDKSDTVYAEVRSVSSWEKGPLVNSIKVEYEVRGCKSFTLEIRLVYQSDRIELINDLEKLPELQKEMMSFNFDMPVKNGRILYEIPWGVVDPKKDILKGSNTNYYTVQHFIDVSNESTGITLFSPDAPLAKFLDANNSQHFNYNIESSIINNHWHTNFLASQEGQMVFRYGLRFHKVFNLAEATRTGLEIVQPMVVMNSINYPIRFPVTHMQSDAVIVTSCKPSDSGSGFQIRLYNPSDKNDKVKLSIVKGFEIWESNFSEEKIQLTPENFEMKPFEVKTLNIEK